MDTGRNKQPPFSHSVGRVVIDGRGRNVWQWNDDQLDSTSILLKRLDNEDLALEPTRQFKRLNRKAGTGEGQDARSAGAQRRSEAEKREPETTVSELEIEQTFNVKVGGGFDPYNRS